ncbi:hypothetical protein RhiirC2_793025 [Rhizophagus irregularis]|uniref:Uncharacterized protein n=1 Tax=Rhizophagus irregularis TaxID=588596 RepID=A0A2N1MGA3_9GLOM|nr:hypothetical protein RhiirC2_793025 [Rhizophagus irregularis]
MTDNESFADEPDVTEFNRKVNELRSKASPKLPNIKMTPVDQPVIPENSQKKDKQKHPKIPIRKRNHPNPRPLRIRSCQKGARANLRHNSLRYLVYLRSAEDNSRVKTIKLSVQVSDSSFALLQFNKYWTTDLKGIPVKWFPASWTLQERKQCEKFQAEACKLKAKNTLSKKKSGYTDQASGSNQPKKKDKVPFLKKNQRNNNQLKSPAIQKKTKNTSKNKDYEKDNKEVLAEILFLLRLALNYANVVAADFLNANPGNVDLHIWPNYTFNVCKSWKLWVFQMISLILLTANVLCCYSKTIRYSLLAD